MSDSAITGSPTNGKTKRKTTRVQWACFNCRRRKQGCDSVRPCKRCVEKGIPCVEVESKRKRGRVRKDEWPPNGQNHLHPHRHKHNGGDEAKMSVSPASVSDSTSSDEASGAEEEDEEYTAPSSYLPIERDNLTSSRTEKSDEEESPIISSSAPENAISIPVQSRAHSSSVSGMFMGPKNSRSVLPPHLTNFDPNNNNSPAVIPPRGPGLVITSLEIPNSNNSSVIGTPVSSPFPFGGTPVNNHLPNNQNNWAQPHNISVSPSLHHHHNHNTMNVFEQNFGQFQFGNFGNSFDIRSVRGRPNYSPVNLAMLCPFLEHMPNANSIDSLINSIDGSSGLMDVHGALDFESESHRENLNFEIPFQLSETSDCFLEYCNKLLYQKLIENEKCRQDYFQVRELWRETLNSLRTLNWAKAQASLQEIDTFRSIWSEEVFRNAPAVVIWSAGGRIHHANEAFCNLTGYRADELRVSTQTNFLGPYEKTDNMNANLLFHPSETVRVLQKQLEALQNQQTPIFTYQVRTRLLMKNKREIAIQCAISNLRDSSGWPVLTAMMVLG